MKRFRVLYSRCVIGSGFYYICFNQYKSAVVVLTICSRLSKKLTKSIHSVLCQIVYDELLRPWTDLAFLYSYSILLKVNKYRPQALMSKASHLCIVNITSSPIRMLVSRSFACPFGVSQFYMAIWHILDSCLWISPCSHKAKELPLHTTQISIV